MLIECLRSVVYLTRHREKHRWPSRPNSHTPSRVLRRWAAELMSGWAAGFAVALLTAGATSTGRPFASFLMQDVCILFNRLVGGNLWPRPGRGFTRVAVHVLSHDAMELERKSTGAG
jgi:hypothetical protein